MSRRRHDHVTIPRIGASIILGILIDAVVLIVLLKTIVDEEVGFLVACAIALGASILTSFLAILLTAAIGIAGVFVAALIAAALLGVVVSAICGAEIKRALAIGGIFTIVHVGVSFAFYFMFAK